MLKRKILVVSLLAIVILLTAGVVLAQGVRVVANDNLSLRSGPASSSNRLATVPYQTEMDAFAISTDRNWVAVTVNGQRGWLSLSYTGVLEGSLGALNVSDQTFTGNEVPVTSSVMVSPTVNLRYRDQPTLDVRPLGAIPYTSTVPALGLSQDATFVMVSYNGQNVWVYREYVQATEGSLDSLVPGAAPISVGMADFAGVCGGAGVPDAAPYAGGPGPHPVLVMDEAANIHDWNSAMAGQTTANPAEVQLVACVSEESERLIEECPYDGPNIFRYVYERRVNLYNAQTGQRIANTTLTGADPRNCLDTEPWDLVRLAGPSVDLVQLRDWLAWYVNP